MDRERFQRESRDLQARWARDVIWTGLSLIPPLKQAQLSFWIAKRLLKINIELWRRIDLEDLELVNDALRPFSYLFPLNWPQYASLHFTSWVIRSYDPNDKLAPAGHGTAGFIQSDSTLDYTIRFENMSDATAPAREVIVTDTLDESLDLDTFELTEIAFADYVISIPPGLDQYEDWVPATVGGQEILVEVQAGLDHETRVLTLALRSLDPVTGWFPEDPFVGLLYPNDETGRGEGHISFLVRPLADLPSGTEITNWARIYFDYNDPIDTPLVRNTLDAGPPSSSVVALPESVA